MKKAKTRRNTISQKPEATAEKDDDANDNCDAIESHDRSDSEGNNMSPVVRDEDVNVNNTFDNKADLDAWASCLEIALLDTFTMKERHVTVVILETGRFGIIEEIKEPRRLDIRSGYQRGRRAIVLRSRNFGL
jgi:hypothetical protein